MKKVSLFFSFFLISSLITHASSCITLRTNLLQGKGTQEVRVLQDFLVDKGFLTVTPNGYFGPSTLRAVRMYQDSVGLPDNGEVYASTRQAIEKETCNSHSISAASSLASSTVVQTIQTVTPQASMVSTPSCLDLKTDLMRGIGNKEVLALQQFLMKQELLEVMPNGYFGPSTFTAVKEYQQNNNLKVTGKVLLSTRVLIRKETCTKNASGAGEQTSQVTTATGTGTALIASSTIIISGTVNSSLTTSPQTIRATTSVSIIPNGMGTVFHAKSTHMKLATVTIHAGEPVTLTALMLVASSSLPLSTISNFTLTDLFLDKIINRGPSFIFTNEKLIGGQSKVYEVYADIGDILGSSTSAVDFKGSLVFSNTEGLNTVIQIPNFSVLVGQ